MTTKTTAPKPPVSTQRNTRKMVTIIAPNLTDEDTKELDAATLREILHTYTALKAHSTTEGQNVTTLEISEGFFTTIRNNYQFVHGPIAFGQQLVHDAENSTIYLCLSLGQFRDYLQLYTNFLAQATTDAVSNLNALTEETATLKPLLALLDTPATV